MKTEKSTEKSENETRQNRVEVQREIKCQGIYEQWPGQCCCHCKWQRVIMKHPWNKGDGKGRISDVMGYGCEMPEFQTKEGKPQLIFFDNEHGMCECYLGT